MQWVWLWPAIWWLIVLWFKRKCIRDKLNIQWIIACSSTSFLELMCFAPRLIKVTWPCFHDHCVNQESVNDSGVARRHYSSSSTLPLRNYLWRNVRTREDSKPQWSHAAKADRNRYSQSSMNISGYQSNKESFSRSHPFAFPLLGGTLAVTISITQFIHVYRHWWNIRLFAPGSDCTFSPPVQNGNSKALITSLAFVRDPPDLKRSSFSHPSLCLS